MTYPGGIIPATDFSEKKLHNRLQDLYHQKVNLMINSFV
ncbi:hypothetical protein SAMN05192553_101796 [Cyclobacterium xiamenense]|uniref:Uncharacterized protein n=1 Tax=Cyclobacterium xiamenense TaxID=1297121 RepID=A0A1H6UJD9_9BACT|nr:hypothetical protein SAMN05192553_101796 [Cyclobacterium xiamenense]